MLLVWSNIPDVNREENACREIINENYQTLTDNKVGISTL